MRGEKLRHQLGVQRAHRCGAAAETADQLALKLETSEIATAAMTARLRLPEIEPKDQPKRRPIPDHIPRMEGELAPSGDRCAGCGGALRRLGEDVTEELEYVPGRVVVNRSVRPRFACAGCKRFLQAPLPTRCEPMLDLGPQLVHVQITGVDQHIRARPERCQNVQLAHDPFRGPVIRRQGMPTARFRKPAQQDVGVAIKVKQFRRQYRPAGQAPQ